MANPTEATISAQNTFSDAIGIDHHFNFSLISNSFVGTVTLQRRFNAADSWRDIATYTGSFESWDKYPGGGQLRFGVKTGDYTSGSVVGRISNARS